MIKYSDSNTKKNLQRRKILGWLGLGAVGAMVFKILPIKKIVSKKFMRHNTEKIPISMNKSAVKRSKRIKGNV